MKKILTFIFFISTLNADILLGLYSGISMNKADVKVSSSSLTLDNTQSQINNSASILGVKVGLANDSFRYYASYDKSGDDTLKLTRSMMNFDYIFYSKNRNFHPIIGGAVGYGQSNYTIQNETVKQTNGLASLKLGLIYTLQKHSIDFTYEYTHVVNTGHTSDTTFVSGTDFNKFNLDSQSNTSFILGYSFRF